MRLKTSVALKTGPASLFFLCESVLKEQKPVNKNNRALPSSVNLEVVTMKALGGGSCRDKSERQFSCFQSVA